MFSQAGSRKSTDVGWNAGTNLRSSRWVRILQPDQEKAITLTLPDEEMDICADQTAQDINLRGKIHVSISRGYYTQPKQPLELWNGYDPPDTRISSKPIVKVNHVSHAFDRLTGGEPYIVTKWIGV